MSETATGDFKSKFQVLLELRQARDIDKAKLKVSEKAYREYEAALFTELNDAGIRGRLTFDFGPLGTAKFQRRSTIYGRVLNKAEAINALRALGKDEIILQEAVAEGRLNELVRDYLETKKELPEGIDFYTRDAITISQS